MVIVVRMFAHCTDFVHVSAFGKSFSQSHPVIIHASALFLLYCTYSLNQRGISHDKT